MTIDISQFHQTFFEESYEGLDIMESALLGLGTGTPDSETINTIFRAIHSIKGGSGTFGFTIVTNFTHVMETLLDEIRDGKREVTTEIKELLLQGIDVVREMLNATKDATPFNAEQSADVQNKLEIILGKDATPTTTTENIAEQNVEGWKISFKPHKGMLKTGNDPIKMIRILSEMGELEIKSERSDLPSLPDLDPENSYIGWQMTLKGNIDKAEIIEVFEWVDDECDLTITAIEADTTAVTATSETSASPAATKQQAATIRTGSESTSIRVDIQKVDEIINLVGELVITQSMLGQLGEELEAAEVVGQKHITNLHDGLGQLERNTRELQESVMRIRMLPISFVFNRFPRMVHDLASKLDKKIELKLSGETTELDKTVMEKIGDPMVHLVRNSLDHGIETRQQRLDAGKSETGTIHLNAFHQGGYIVIVISDDGAGINVDRVRKKAIEKGLISKDDDLSDDEIHRLIFHAGFSTVDQVSDISGRGVGMDVVRKNILALGGSVEIASQQGVGSSFTIKLPLTLAILDGQLVRVGSETYILPLISIVESLQIRKNQISVIGGIASVYQLRDEYIPIVHLSSAFGIEPDTHELSGGLMVVVEGGGAKAGLIVDDLLGQQQVVIKSLESNFRRIDGISGATILGDGTVALIIDVTGLIHFSRTLQNDKPPKSGKHQNSNDSPSDNPTQTDTDQHVNTQAA